VFWDQLTAFSKTKRVKKELPTKSCLIVIDISFRHLFWLLAAGKYSTSRNKQAVKIRFYIHPETELPHIYNHDVSESEVEDILSNPGEDRPGKQGAWVAIGRTSEGRYLRVIYVPDPEPNSVFVITAYELHGKPLTAYRRRRRRKKR
jgi:hypothetical protein